MAIPGYTLAAQADYGLTPRHGQVRQSYGGRHHVPPAAPVYLSVFVYAPTVSSGHHKAFVADLPTVRKVWVLVQGTYAWNHGKGYSWWTSPKKFTVEYVRAYDGCRLSRRESVQLINAIADTLSNQLNLPVSIPTGPALIDQEPYD